MAKALLGYSVTGDARAMELALQNRRLRERITDLEELIVRLSRDNDELSAQLRSVEDVLEPA
ncbi:MAG TPA: hypothetical protein P5108_09760 [Marmoricola sp.]|jgi:hypothetical protein|nr:hypothetical protein [Nocardioidaceae bacterium]MCB8993209.1 hypothetical protein [Nocardioidaceae bacterium]MCO5323137.1 hypothetical protein [Nocardioidaceae bacterium]HRV69722.1 hypothetical protein [Marmoricola sp.]